MSSPLAGPSFSLPEPYMKAGLTPKEIWAEVLLPQRGAPSVMPVSLLKGITGAPDFSSSTSTPLWV